MKKLKMPALRNVVKIKYNKCNCLEQKWMLTTYNNISLLLSPIYLQSILMTTCYLTELCYNNSPRSSTRFLSLYGWQTALLWIQRQLWWNCTFLTITFFKICHFDPQNKALERFSDWLIHSFYWKRIHFLMRKL